MTTIEIISAALELNCTQYKRSQHEFDLQLSYMGCPIINTIKYTTNKTLHPRNTHEPGFY